MRLAAILAAAACSAAVPSPSRPIRAQAPAPVEAVPVDEAEVSESAILLGATEARRVSVVAAAIEGKVVDFPAKEGKRVKEGEVLARLSDDVLIQELKGAEAALAELREWHQKAQRDLRRARELIARDATTQKELDAVETAEKTYALRIQKAEADIEALKINLEKKKVKAPFEGQVVRELTETGQWLPSGGAVARVVDLSSVYVRFNLPERHVGSIEEGRAIEVLVEAAGPRPYAGKIASISGEGDPGAKTFPVRVEIPNDGRLRSGMSARSEFLVGAKRRALLVPKDAVLLESGKRFVFVVNQGIAEKRRIETGVSSAGGLEVVEGLSRGEMVVVKGNERIQPGAPVRVLAPRVGKSP